ncbi:cupin domain-containing protein [Actinoplanes sp. NPDC049265]|uniref:cupin domain-containing protein n=1 Tax=Actinoplanes sp. NPDC049265 TaxID=3363902 RepID=UPI003714B152
MSLKRVGLSAALVAAAITGTVAATGSAALATPPGPGVKGVIIWQKTVGDTDFILRDITIPAGQATGWHYHQGTLYAQVKNGTLSHFDSTCASDGTYRKGQFLSEPSGAGNVHIGRNLGATDVVLEVLYVNPAGAPLSTDAPNPGCDFE